MMGFISSLSEVEIAKRNRRLSEPGDWDLFFEKIAECNRNKDFSQHEIKLSANRKMAIFYGRNGWQASIQITSMAGTL